MFGTKPVPQDHQPHYLNVGFSPLRESKPASHKLAERTVLRETPRKIARN